MADITGLDPICPDNPKWFVQMYAAPLPACDGPAFQQALYERHGIEIPVTELGEDRYLRVSVQGYNTEEDVERTLGAVAEMLPGFVNGVS
jgi:isopenicillin-N epimerase